MSGAWLSDVFVPPLKIPSGNDTSDSVCVCVHFLMLIRFVIYRKGGGGVIL